MAEKNRYLLCRPRGGLNDTLCQIEFCWRYATQFRRTLIVDTSQTTGAGLCYPFSRCFQLVEPSPGVDLDPSEERLRQLNDLTAFPAQLQGRIDRYVPVFDQTLGNYKDVESNTKLSFYFDRDHDEEVLIHDQCGGAIIGADCLARLTLAPQFRSDVLERCGPLEGQSYLAAAVRHTDYKSAYGAFFEGIYPEVVGRKLLVCSDSAEVLRYATDFLSQAEVVTLANAVDSGGLGHAEYAQGLPPEMRYAMLVNTISDLVALASSEKLFVAPLSQGVGAYLGIGGYSGFHILALTLASRRPVIEQLVGRSLLNG